jgi:hypothetical protein
MQWTIFHAGAKTGFAVNHIESTQLKFFKIIGSFLGLVTKAVMSSTEVVPTLIIAITMHLSIFLNASLSHSLLCTHLRVDHKACKVVVIFKTTYLPRIKKVFICPKKCGTISDFRKPFQEGAMNLALYTNALFEM